MTTHCEQTLHLPAPPEAVWKLAADTERLNREMGLPSISFSFTPREAGGTEANACVQVAGIALRSVYIPVKPQAED